MNKSARLSTVACSGLQAPAVGGGRKHETAVVCSPTNGQRTKELRADERKVRTFKVRAWLAAFAFSSLLWLGSFFAVAKAHVPGCHSRACDKRIHEKRREHWKRTHIWQYRWNHLTAWERRWTRCISFHESGNRRVARESAHLSYFQWALPTWHAAGGSGNPEVSAGWHEQAVRAVRWAHQAGSSQWTTSGICGAV